MTLRRPPTGPRGRRAGPGWTNGATPGCCPSLLGRACLPRALLSCRAAHPPARPGRLRRQASLAVLSPRTHPARSSIHVVDTREVAGMPQGVRWRIANSTFRCTGKRGSARDAFTLSWSAPPGPGEAPRQPPPWLCSAAQCSSVRAAWHGLGGVAQAVWIAPLLRRQRDARLARGGRARQGTSAARPAPGIRPGGHPAGSSRSPVLPYEPEWWGPGALLSCASGSVCPLGARGQPRRLLGARMGVRDGPPAASRPEHPTPPP